MAVIEPFRLDVPQAELDGFLANLKTVMAGTVSRLPTHRQFLEGMGAKLEAVAA